MELLENPDPKSILNLDTLPNGYTYFLLVLKKLSLLNSSTIIFSNIALYLLGLYPLILLLKDKNNKYLFLLLCFCSWVVQKHLLYPLSEALYIFVANWSLYLFIVFQKKSELYKLILAILFVGLAFKVRTIGITLIPLLPLSILLNTDLMIKIRGLRPWIIITTTIGFIGTFGVFVKINFININRYLNDAKTQVETEVIATAINNLEIHLYELGQIAFNLSKSQLTGLLKIEQLSKLFFIVVGIGSFMLIMWLIFSGIKRKSLIHIYALLFILVIFAWPYSDPRFWVPVIPILLYLIVEINNDIFKTVIVTYTIIWVSIGFMTNFVLLNQSLSASALIQSLQEPTKSDYVNYFQEKEIFNQEIKNSDYLDYDGIDFRFETVRLLKTYSVKHKTNKFGAFQN